MYEVSNKVPAAASVQVSMDKEEVSNDVVNHTTKPQRPSSAGAAVLVNVQTPPPASLVAVLPAAHDDNKNKKDQFLLKVVCVWSLIHAFVFAFEDISILTKWTWMNPPPYVALTDAAAAEASALLHGQLCCIAAAALAAPASLYMLLKARTTAAVDALLVWVALAATAGIHYAQVASDRIYLAADPGDTHFFIDFVLAYASTCLTVDVVLAGFLLLLCCRRLGLGEHQGDDDGEV